MIALMRAGNARGEEGECWGYPRRAAATGGGGGDSHGRAGVRESDRRRRLTNGLEGLGEDGGEGLGELVHVGGDLVVAVLDFVVPDLVRLVEYHVALSHVVVVAPPSHLFPHLTSWGIVTSLRSCKASILLTCSLNFAM